MEIPTAFSEGSCFAVALVFAVSALTKLRHPGAFVAGLRGYRVLPSKLVPAAAAVVVVAEMAVAGMLGSQWLLGWGLAIAAILLACFTVAVSINLVRGAEPRCHCFGAREDDTVSIWTLVRIGLLAAGVATSILAARSTGDVVAGGWQAEVVTTAATGTGMVIAARWLLMLPTLLRLFHSSELV